jgi:nucleoside-diphosphate-sugar epimerase
MSHSILLTGVSGYLGGSLLAQIGNPDSGNLAAYKKLFALVRTDAQASAVRTYGAEPLRIDVNDASAVKAALLEHDITVVFFLIDALNAATQAYFIDGLAAVKAKLSAAAAQTPEATVQVHFLHTSGAKIFSSHAGAPTDGPLFDDDPALHAVQKAQRPVVPLLASAIAANTGVVERADACGVRSYVFVPCIVYGRGRGFGNRISIQTVAIVKAARAARHVYSVDDESKQPAVWPVCHVDDNTGLYVALLDAILAGRNPGSGTRGYYLASSGSVLWKDLYAAMARRLAERGIVDDAAVIPAAGDVEVLTKMGKGLGCPPELVALNLGGRYVALLLCYVMLCYVLSFPFLVLG